MLNTTTSPRIFQEISHVMPILSTIILGEWTFTWKWTMSHGILVVVCARHMKFVVTLNCKLFVILNGHFNFSSFIILQSIRQCTWHELSSFKCLLHSDNFDPSFNHWATGGSQVPRTQSRFPTDWSRTWAWQFGLGLVQRTKLEPRLLMEY